LLGRILELALQKIDLSAVPDKREFVVFLGTIVEDQQINGRFQGFRSLFYMSTIDKIIRLSEVVLASLGDEDDELSVLSDLSRTPPFFRWPRICWQGSSPSARKDYSRARSHPQRLSSQHRENPVFKEWFDTAVNVLRSEAFAEIADKWIIMQILLSLQEGREQIPDLLLPHINSDDSIDAIADIIISNETDSAEGTTVACKSEYLRELGDPGIIRARADSRLSDPLVQANKRLVAIYKSIVQQQKIYVDNAEQEQEWSELCS
jgi:hypothetical protein